MKGQEYCKGVSTYMSEDSDNKDGQVVLEDKNGKKIKLITIIGEIEGHDNLPAASKTTKYEHLLPQLAAVENDDTIGGVLFLMNTVGGDVSAGLALSEMIASMHKPTVSLVIGDSHSIGVPLAVSTDYSFIVPTATMIVHPVRMNGNIIGARQTYDYFERIQKRIVSFIARKSDTKEKDHFSCHNIIYNPRQCIYLMFNIIGVESFYRKNWVIEIAFRLCICRCEGTTRDFN